MVDQGNRDTEQRVSFQTPGPADLSQVDPDDGVLSLATFWRPRPHDPKPEMPGEKVSASRSPTRCAAVTPVKPVMSILVLQAQHAVIGIYLAQICGNCRLERHSPFSIPISLIHHRP